MHDDELRFLFAKALERAVPGDNCPAPEELLDAHQGTLDRDGRRAIVDHLAICPVCAEAWRIASLGSGRMAS